MLFAMPKRIEEKKRQDHTNFWCPSGHPLHFSGKSALEIAQEEAAKEKARAERLKQCAEQKLEKIKTQEYKIRHWKGEVTKLKKKVSDDWARHQAASKERLLPRR
jgi:hypothetical protein